MELLQNLIGLFYPKVCPACGSLLNKDEDVICLTCNFMMSKTAYESIADNPVARIFWGRIPFQFVSSSYFFAKGGRIQALIHELKYKSNREAGLFLGRQLAVDIQKAGLSDGVHFLVPVPLHPKKLRSRGYNQSDILAQGMAEVLQIPVVSDNLLRVIASSSQTRKTRDERWENVKNIFEVKQAKQFEGKHILLVDDVITTGSTIAACAEVLMQVPNIKLSVATAACAVN